MNTESLIRCLERCSEDKNSCEQCERYEKNVGSMRCVDNLLVEAAESIRALSADLKEREKIIVQLRKQWQDAEMFICTMCGHFDHKTDGDIVYGNQDCGEIVGYPYCKKFTLWIPVTVRLPDKELEEHREKNDEDDLEVIVMIKGAKEPTTLFYDEEGEFYGVFEDGETVFYLVTHWMPMPNPPKNDQVCECMDAKVQRLEERLGGTQK